MSVVYVGNLDDRATTRDLREEFDRCTRMPRCYTAFRLIRLSVV